MKMYETSVRVGDRGEVRVAGAPFAPGTEVEVTISPKRAPADQFGAAWSRLCSDLRAIPGIRGITDQEINDEVQRHRTGR